MVNGSLIYPEGLSDTVSKIQVNGTQKSYPDNAICLLKDVDVDKYFILRARQDTPYFINGMIKLLERFPRSRRINSKKRNFFM